MLPAECATWNFSFWFVSHGWGPVTSGRNLALWLAVLAAAGRFILGFFVAMWASVNPEANMVVLFDLPTLGVYAFMATLGGQVEIRDAGDLRFMAAGVAVWFVLTYAGTRLFLVARRGRMPR